MSLARFCRKPACRRAEDLLRRIVAGDAEQDEEAEFSAHVRTCAACARTLGKVRALAQALTVTLTDTADAFPPPGRLDLPERVPPLGRGIRFSRILIDLTGFIVIGIGLFLLLGISFLGYRSAVRARADIRRFEAVQNIVRLNRVALRIVKGEPGIHLPEVRRRLERYRNEGERRTGAFSWVDPWGAAYILVLEDGRFSARSAGPNGTDEHGSGDDITAQTRAPALGRYRQPPADHSR